MRIEPLRAPQQLGHIEVGLVEPVTFTIVSAGPTLFSWMNVLPGSKISLFDILPDLDEAALHRAVQVPGGECEFEHEFIGADEKRRVIRFRLCHQDRPDAIGLRLFAVDISELKRKDTLLRSVSNLLHENREVALQSKRNLKAILDSLPQAVFSINSNLVVTSETSTAAQHYFGASITGKHLREFTPLTDDDLDPLMLAFSGVDWDLVIEVLPKQFVALDRTYSLQFSPILEAGELVSVTTVIEDVTDRRRVVDRLEQTNADNRALVAILSAKEEFLDLIDSARAAIRIVDNLQELRMTTHTIKGGFCLFECDDLASLCQAAESSWAKTPYSPEQGREFVACLNQAIDRFLTQNREILQIRCDHTPTQAQPLVKLSYQSLSALYETARTHKVEPEILRLIEELLEVPIPTALGWLDALWQKTLLKEGKEGLPIVWRGNASICREPYKELFQSFVHIIRNAVDHAIERPFDRTMRGKPAAGCLTIESSCIDGIYTITFQDDGRGIDPSAVVQVARTRGVAVPESVTPEEAFMLLCESGVSSKSEVTELSGRGIGLDVVRRRAQALGGDLSITSELGKGTAITVRFPRAQSSR